MTYCIVIFAMAILVYTHNGVFDTRRICPFCGGRRRHGRNCPRKDND